MSPLHRGERENPAQASGSHLPFHRQWFVTYWPAFCGIYEHVHSQGGALVNVQTYVACSGRMTRITVAPYRWYSIINLQWDSHIIIIIIITKDLHALKMKSQSMSVAQTIQKERKIQ